MGKNLVEVAVNAPAGRTFTYELPAELADLAPGQRVAVPFGRGAVLGFVLGPGLESAGLRFKAVTERLDDTSFFTDELFRFCLWMADYYLANPADCLLAALPPQFKKRSTAVYAWGSSPPSNLPAGFRDDFKAGQAINTDLVARFRQLGGSLWSGWLDRSEVVAGLPQKKEPAGRGWYRCENTEHWESHIAAPGFAPVPFAGPRSRAQLKVDGWTDYRISRAVKKGCLAPTAAAGAAVLGFVTPRAGVRDFILTTEQQTAVDAIAGSLADGFSVSLLHGVTGSGKTLVYCRIIEKVLAAGNTALMLTPEIALSSTTLAYLRGYFDDSVTVIHSAMTDRERLESWQGIRSGKYRIVVGPRSALFAPLPHLGLIIVDEEHDGSYKQDDPAPRFQGRDSAIMRAQMADIPVVLGSASPSVESYYHAVTGKYRLLELTHRPAGSALPDITLVDMKTDRLGGDLHFVSHPLKLAVDERLRRGEQTILFLNRRGHSAQLRCRDCGFVPDCPDCRVTLTYHRVGHRLTCHYCGFTLTDYDCCRKCRSHDFFYDGVGTQRLEESLPRLFKEARLVRLDSDSASGRQNAYTILSDFADRKYDILLGTQMVTKGLDLPDVTLVGVMSADIALDLPDFRASERAFARLLQVAGRSGRRQRAGQVLVQTYDPSNETIRHAAEQDYRAFFDSEIQSRQALGYPPFGRLISIEISGTVEDSVERAAKDLRRALDTRLREHRLSAALLGPAPCPMYILRGRYRRRLLLKTAQSVKIGRMLSAWGQASPRLGLPASLRVTIDIDPDNMM